MMHIQSLTRNRSHLGALAFILATAVFGCGADGASSSVDQSGDALKGGTPAGGNKTQTKNHGKPDEADAGPTSHGNSGDHAQAGHGSSADHGAQAGQGQGDEHSQAGHGSSADHGAQAGHGQGDEHNQAGHGQGDEHSQAGHGAGGDDDMGTDETK
jgi:hypothetical protein